jgi:hypothetical protein
MELESKIRFAVSTVRPMAEYTLPYLATVIGVLEEGKKGEHVGSGLRCTLAGRPALVTALHVIDKAMTYPGFAISAGFGVPPQSVHGEIHWIPDERSDLVILFLSPEYPDPGARLAFWPETRIDFPTDRLATDYLFVHGFPGQRSAFSQQGNGLLSQSLPYGVMQCLDNLPPDLEPFQFALDFDPCQVKVEAGNSEELPDPRGLSGSPVWRVGASGRSIKEWSPDWSLLVGIVTQWRPDYNLLVAVTAATILEMIQPAPASK